MRTLVLALMFLASSPVWAGELQCDCPTVKAKGTGDSSCTATETGDTCTIDFNTFDPEDEEEAFQFLSYNTSYQVDFNYFDRKEYPGGFNQEVAQKLALRDANALVDQILIYVLVSGVQSSLHIDGKVFSSVHETLRQNSERVSQVFALEEGVDGSSLSYKIGYIGEVKVVFGCVELNLESYWGMFKAFWTESKNAPQCM